MAAMGDEALIGRVLDDRYVIGERIARGGMASVFMATDTRLDRVVAVKVMHSGMGDDRQFTERFVREARSAAKLNHSNVVAVFDQGSDGEVTYLVMEYVPGNTLRDVMREECPMPPRRALTLLEQILIALSAAHSARIIHRDVKPENVLITPTGEIKVADFGLARAVSAATTATGGTLIGTVSYLAPEIVLNAGADARSDVYACGALLYEMLTGLKPHAGETPIQVAYKHVHEDIHPPSESIESIPPYLDALVARTTARDRDQRSADAHVMLQQVRQVLRAIDAGLADDPDLTRDLLPRPASAATNDGTSENENTDPIPSVNALSTYDLPDEPTAAFGALTAGAPEATLHWRAESTPSVVRRGMHPQMTSAQYQQVKTDHPPAKRGKVLLIAAIVLAVLVALLGWYFGIGRYVSTPPLTGMAESVAKTTAQSEGFTFKVDEKKYSETAPLGTVISTSPAPGTKILPKSTIGAVVSKGKERYKVPKLKGKSIDEATTILGDLHLTLGTRSEKFDEKVKAGDLVGTKLDAGTQVKRNTAIDVYISKGRQPINVKNYQGSTKADAVAALESAGFTVNVTTQFSNDVKKDIVISQDPNGGTKFKNDAIALTVSKGPALIAVPAVVGKRGNEAESILTGAGFQVKWSPVKFGNAKVQSQNPSGKAAKGATITLSQLGF